MARDAVKYIPVGLVAEEKSLAFTSVTNKTFYYISGKTGFRFSSAHRGEVVIILLLSIYMIFHQIHRPIRSAHLLLLFE